MARQSPSTMRRRILEAEADLAFEYYYQLGADRSLAKLRESLVAAGVKPKVAHTYESWSVKFEWQDRLVTREQAHVRQLAGQQAAVAAERQTAHQLLGAALVGVGARNLQAYAETNVNGLPRVILKPHEVADFIRTGKDIERESLGLDSDRTSIRVEAMSECWDVLQKLFRDVMTLKTDAERMTSWLDRGKQRVAQLLMADVGHQVPGWLQIDPIEDLTEAEEAAVTMTLSAVRDGREMPDFGDYPPLPPQGGYAVDAAGIEVQQD